MKEVSSYLAVGFSQGLLRSLDGLVPSASVVVAEERDVIESRSVHVAARDYACVAELVVAAVQAEDNLDALIGGIVRPPALRAVLPTVEYSVVAAAALAEAWDMPGAGLAAARIFRDKARLRRVAGVAGLAQPDWQLAASVEDVAAFRARYGGGYVLKPANLQASIGVQLLGADDEVTAAWLRSTSADDPRLRARRPLAARYLVEERLSGPEVSAESLVADGKVIFTNFTAKAVLHGRHPVEVGHVVPAPLPAAVSDALTRLVSGLVAASGFGSGLLHSEWILVGGTRPHLVECAARKPGDRIDELIDLAYGGSLVGDYLATLSGRTVHRSTHAVRAAAVRFLRAEPGTVVDVRGRSDAQRAIGVEAVSVTPAVGDTVEALTSSWQRVGHVIAVGSDVATAVARAEHAVSLIDVVTKVTR